MIRARALALAVGAALPAAIAAGTSADGAVALAISSNGRPVAAPQVEVAIRSREVEPPRVAAEGRGPTRFALPPGRYDCIVRHAHLPQRPLRYHRFEVLPGATTTLASDVALFTLTVLRTEHPGRVVELLVQDPASREAVRRPRLEPLTLPPGPYRIRLTVERNGVRIQRETMLLLDRDRTITLEL